MLYDITVLHKKKVNFAKSSPNLGNIEHKFKYIFKENPKNQQDFVSRLTWSGLLSSTWQNGEDRVRKDKER